MVVTCHKSHTCVASTEQTHHVKVRPRRVYPASLVTKVFDSLVAGQHNHDASTQDQGIDFSTDEMSAYGHDRAGMLRTSGTWLLTMRTRTLSPISGTARNRLSRAFGANFQ